MQILLFFLVALSPQHKQLVNMVKQGDMFAADELARTICDLESSARAKAASEVRRRLRKSKGKAVDMLRQGLDRCAPAGQERSDEPKEARRPDRSRHSEPASGRRPLRLLAGEGDSASPSATGEGAATRRPVTAAPKASSSPQKGADSKGSRRVLAALPEGDNADSADEGDAEPGSDLPALAPLAAEREPTAVTARMPSGGALSGSRETLRDAMFYYGVGGGFVAASSMSYLMAVAALGWGVFSTVTLPPLAKPDGKTNGGKTLQQVRDQQVTGIWLQNGGLAFASVVVATGSLVAGMVLMGKGGEAVEAY